MQVLWTLTLSLLSLRLTDQQIYNHGNNIVEYLNFEQSLKLRWCRARDLFGPQIPVTTGGFELRISKISKLSKIIN